jgi:hypothetical protein
MVEVDISFPKEIHELLKQFVPCPENIIPKQEWLSDYQDKLQTSTKANTNTTKLVAHLYDRKNYTLHYRNLIFLLTLKVKVNNIEYKPIITEVHNIISFKQSACMKPYMLGNNDLRKEAKHEFEKDFFKLMKNSVFGKTTENVNHRIDLRLTTDQTMAVKQWSMLNFKKAKYIDCLYMIDKYKTKVVMYKPIYVGCASLELSKLTMFKLHYKVIEKHFKTKYTLPYGDTDSFVYNIKHPDIYEWIKENKKHFDLSYYKRKDMQDDTNKKKLGCFKDELNGMVMSEFVGLNPNSYAFKYQNIEKKKATGVSKAVVDKLINFNDYKNTLYTNKPAIREVVSIRSFNQQLFTYKQDKIALTSFYDKMKTIDSINCEPYGYIKYEHDDTNNIINEVKDVKPNTSIDDNDK